MLVDKKIMAQYRENPEKIKEIFETQRAVDMDREEFRVHLRYAGNDSLRHQDIFLRNCGITCASLPIFGVGLWLLPKDPVGIAFVATYIAAFSGFGIVSDQLFSRFTNYEGRRAEAQSNLEESVDSQ